VTTGLVSNLARDIKVNNDIIYIAAQGGVSRYDLNTGDVGSGDLENR